MNYDELHSRVWDAIDDAESLTGGVNSIDKDKAASDAIRVVIEALATEAGNLEVMTNWMLEESVSLADWLRSHLPESQP